MQPSLAGVVHGSALRYLLAHALCPLLVVGRSGVGAGSAVSAAWRADAAEDRIYAVSTDRDDRLLRMASPAPFPTLDL